MMRRQALSRQRQRHHVDKIAAGHRGRKSQTTESVEKEEFANDVPRGFPMTPEASEEVCGMLLDVGEELLDSLLPPPPQLRCGRTTPDPEHEVRSKNTGIKHRDRSGQKHPVKRPQT